MHWKINLSHKSLKALAKINPSDKAKILKFMGKLETSANPRTQGKSLTGGLKGLWRYRVGNYRLICEIKNAECIVLVVSLGHRKQIYKN